MSKLLIKYYGFRRIYKKYNNQIVSAINESSEKLNREIRVNNPYERGIEFDVAVTVEKKKGGGGEIGAEGKVSVFPFVNAKVKGNGTVKGEVTNSTVTRIKFGINIGSEKNSQILTNKQNKYKPNGGYN